MQGCLEPLLYLLPCEGLVAMGRHQTLLCGEYGAVSVALDASSFEHKVQMVLVGTLYGSLLHECAADAVVLFGGELHSPSVELEVQQAALAIGLQQRDEPMVACPSVVGGHLAKAYSAHLLAAQSAFEQCSHSCGMRCHHQQIFPAGDGLTHVQVALSHFVQDGQPVGVLVRPGQLHAPLAVPFRWQPGGLLS